MNLVFKLVIYCKIIRNELKKDEFEERAPVHESTKSMLTGNIYSE